MLAQNMRPKFNQDTYYIPLPDGIYLRGNNRSLMLKGKSLYALLKHLIPHLTGNATLAELTNGLDARRTDMITNLLEKLFVHQLLRDVSLDQPHPLRSEEQETYAANLAFIESFQPSAAHRFACFREKQLLIIGSGTGFTSLIQACLQSGVKRINAIVTPEGEADSGSQQALFDELTSRDSEQTVQVLSAPSWDNEADVRKILQTYDAILHISDQPMVARSRLLNRLCIEEQKTCIQAIIVNDHAWIGPLVCPETSGCWECAWRRLQANTSALSEPLAPYEFDAQPQPTRSQSLAMPDATIIANQLILALFKYFTQTGSPETAGQVSVLQVETGLSERHTFLPHPHCQACQHPVAPTASQFLERIQQLQHLDPIDPHSFLECITERITDTRFGLFTAIKDDHFVQVPLATYKTNLSNPMRIKDRPDCLNITAISRETNDARLRATQQACTRYAANLVDQRRLLTPETAQLHTFSTLTADQLLTTQSNPTQEKLWTWALDLHTQQPSLIPATQVFSTLHNQNCSAESERGIASGMVWEEAICLALLDWCNYLTIEQLSDTQHTYPQVDLTRTQLTPEGRYLYQLLETAIEQKITVYDVTGSLQAPTFAICCGERVVAYSTHYESVQALGMGFERALQQYQSKQYPQFEYTIAPVPDLPAALRGNQLSVPRYTLPDTWSSRQEWLLQRFRINGLHAFAVPLDHDPVLSQILPFIVRVLLNQTKSEKGE